MASVHDWSSQQVGYRTTKYLVIRTRPSPVLHIVAFKGGDRINTLCGESFLKKITSTVMTLPRNHTACKFCQSNST